MFEIVVAYYFLIIQGTATFQHGPFSTDSQCERTRQWVTRNLDGPRKVSECWYGPAISLARPGKER